MFIRETEAKFSKIASQKYQCNITARLGRHYSIEELVWITLEADECPLSYFSGRSLPFKTEVKNSCWEYNDFLALSIEKRVEAMISACEYIYLKKINQSLKIFLI